MRMRYLIWGWSLGLANGVWLLLMIITKYEKVHILFGVYWINIELIIKKAVLYMSYFAYEKFLVFFDSNTISRFEKHHLWFVYIHHRKIKLKNISHLQDLDVNLVLIEQFCSLLYCWKGEDCSFYLMAKIVNLEQIMEN